jgi:Fe/S biogenesis protein NfuA
VIPIARLHSKGRRAIVFAETIRSPTARSRPNEREREGYPGVWRKILTTHERSMIELTDAARAKIQSLADGGEPRSPLERQYAISLVEREDKEKTEIAINLEGIRVLLNLDTSNLLGGATVDWGEGGFSVETPKPFRPPVTTREGTPGLTGPLADRVQIVLDTLVNPRIAAHGGAVELVDVSDDTIYVRMSGGCQGCSASAATLRIGVERMVKEEVPEVREVVDLTDHEAGANPYY